MKCHRKHFLCTPSSTKQRGSKPVPGRTVRVIVAEFLLRFVALRRRAARRRRAVDVDGGVATTLRRSERSQRICHVRRRCRHRRQGWQLDARITRGVPELRGDRDAVRRRRDV